jgi:hypothetical protein
MLDEFRRFTIESYERPICCSSHCLRRFSSNVILLPTAASYFGSAYGFQFDSIILEGRLSASTGPLNAESGALLG